jgi:uncharacterized protein
MITSLYAGFLGLILFLISMETIKARRAHKISIGVGPNNEIATVVSAHANFVAYVPLLLLLLFFAENSSLISNLIIHALGFAIFLGRLLHYFAFRGPKMNFKWRTLGMYLTLWPLIILGFINIFIYFRIVQLKLGPGL